MRTIPILLFLLVSCEKPKPTPENAVAVPVSVENAPALENAPAVENAVAGAGAGAGENAVALENAPAPAPAAPIPDELPLADSACRADSASAQSCLDLASLHALLAHPDAARAATARACDLGSPSACLRVSRPADALRHATSQCAAGAGDRAACFELARLHMYGLAGAAQSLPAAAALYDELCRRKNPSACKRAAALRDAAGAPIGDPDGETRCSLAADAGAAFDCTLLGDAYVADKDPGAAAVAYRKGCEAGDATSCRRFASALAAGAGLPKDDAAATRMYARACRAAESDAIACVELAARTGDPAVARKLLVDAANTLVIDCEDATTDAEPCAAAGRVLEQLGCAYAAHGAYRDACGHADYRGDACRRADALHRAHDAEWFPPTPPEGQGGGSAPDAECWDELERSREARSARR